MYIIILASECIRYQFISLFAEEYSTSDTGDSTDGEKDQLTTHILKKQGICFESHETKDRQQYTFKTSIILHQILK